MFRLITQINNDLFEKTKQVLQIKQNQNIITTMITLTSINTIITNVHLKNNVHMKDGLMTKEERLKMVNWIWMNQNYLRMMKFKVRLHLKKTKYKEKSRMCTLEYKY